MKAFTRGCALVELACITGIISILCAVAFPAYQDYTKRANVSDLVAAASACREAIALRYREPVAFASPQENGWGCEAGLGSARTIPSPYVLSVTTSADGRITVKARGFNDADIDDRVLTLTPLSAADQPAVFMYDAGRPLFGWRCGSKADETTIGAKYLPTSCRG